MISPDQFLGLGNVSEIKENFVSYREDKNLTNF